MVWMDGLNSMKMIIIIYISYQSFLHRWFFRTTLALLWRRTPKGARNARKKYDDYIKFQFCAFFRNCNVQCRFVFQWKLAITLAKHLRIHMRIGAPPTKKVPDTYCNSRFLLNDSVKLSEIPTTESRSNMMIGREPGRSDSLVLQQNTPVLQ